MTHGLAAPRLEEERQQPRFRLGRVRAGARRALLAAFLSALLPGAGQIYLGRTWRGWAMLGLSLLLIAAGVRVWLMGEIFLLKLLVQPSVLLALLAVDAVVLAFRLFAVLDAYRIGRAERPARGPSGGRTQRYAVPTALVLLLIVTALPHLIAGYYDYITYDMLTDVFAANGRPDVPVANWRFVR